MYRSSAFTFIYKYLFIPIWGGVFLFGIISTWNSDEPSLREWSRGTAIMIGWVMIWLVIILIRLRSVQATQTNFVIKSFLGQKIIEYKDIEWIYQIAMINPMMISLKYYDRESGESKKILIIPSISAQLFKFNILGEVEMTRFIREQLIAAKPEYSKELEPSRWLPLGLVLITGLPIILILEKFF